MFMANGCWFKPSFTLDSTCSPFISTDPGHCSWRHSNVYRMRGRKTCEWPFMKWPFTCSTMQNALTADNACVFNYWNFCVCTVSVSERCNAAHAGVATVIHPTLLFPVFYITCTVHVRTLRRSMQAVLMATRHWLQKPALITSLCWHLQKSSDMVGFCMITLGQGTILTKSAYLRFETKVWLSCKGRMYWMFCIATAISISHPANIVKQHSTAQYHKRDSDP